MIVETSRFGPVEVEDGLAITFSSGILGFPGYRDYVLIQPSEGSYFYWLQAIEDPTLAFVVADPSDFIPTYRVSLRPEQMQDLEFSLLCHTLGIQDKISDSKVEKSFLQNCWLDC